METQTRLSRHDKFISAENIFDVYNNVASSYILTFSTLGST